MNGTDYFTSVKPIQHVTDLGKGEGVTSLPSLSGSCELVQSCLSSTREIVDRTYRLTCNNALLSNFLLQKGSSQTVNQSVIVFCPRAGLSLQTQHSPLYPLLSLPFRTCRQSVYHDVVHHLITSSAAKFLPRLPFLLEQGSSTRGPRATCGPRASFVWPGKGISLYTMRYEY